MTEAKITKAIADLTHRALKSIASKSLWPTMDALMLDLEENLLASPELIDSLQSMDQVAENLLRFADGDLDYRDSIDFEVIEQIVKSGHNEKTVAALRSLSIHGQMLMVLCNHLLRAYVAPFDPPKMDLLYENASNSNAHRVLEQQSL